jgi:hypothetical protein
VNSSQQQVIAWLPSGHTICSTVITLGKFKIVTFFRSFLPEGTPDWRPCHATPRSETMAEGVGFEPTVGFPTLDFESSALNRTQPPFPFAKKNVEQSTSNIERPTQVSRRRSGLRHGWTSRGGFPRDPCRHCQPEFSASRGQKMLQFSACHVCRAYCILYVHTDSHAITCC